jgi:uncharacterized protein (TIRG00374 family)
MPRRKKSYTIPAVKGLVLVIVCAFILTTIDMAETGRLLARTAVLPAGAAVLLFVANRFLSALKWKLLLEKGGIHLSFGTLLRVIYESNFLGIAVPSAIGTDLVRLMQIKRTGESMTVATGSVLADRLLGVMALASLATAAVPFAWPLIDNTALLIAVLCCGGGAVVTIFFLMSDVAFQIYSLVHRWCFSAAQKLSRSGGRVEAFSEKLLSGGERVHGSFAAILKFPLVFAVVLLINVTVQFFRVGQVHFLFRALGAAPPFSVEAAFVPIILLIILLPVAPYMGLGVKEAAFIYFFSQAGIPSETSFSVSILSHLVILAGLIPGGVSFLAGGRFRSGGEGAP